MTGAIILRSTAERSLAKAWIDQMPTHSTIRFAKPKRSLPQNDKLWALLTEVAAQVTYHGVKLTPTDWKDVFTASLKRELRHVPTIDGTGIVILGQRTSEMSVGEMADLIELITAFAAEQGVRMAA